MNYDKLTYAGNLNNLRILEDNTRYSFVEGDINDSNKLKSTILDFNPDAIINFAAESHVDRSIDNPNSFITTNINAFYVCTTYILYNKIF